MFFPPYLKLSFTSPPHGRGRSGTSPFLRPAARTANTAVLSPSSIGSGCPPRAFRWPRLRAWGGGTSSLEPRLTIGHCPAIKFVVPPWATVQRYLYILPTARGKPRRETLLRTPISLTYVRMRRYIKGRASVRFISASPQARERSDDNKGGCRIGSMPLNTAT